MFDPLEQSNQDGRPQLLYEFRLNNRSWRYTSLPYTITIAGQSWEPIPISDDGTRQQGEVVSEILRITLPAAVPFVKFYQGTPPSSTMRVIIRSFHIGDTEVVMRYVGDVAEVDQPVPGTAVVSCNTISASLQRNGLRLTYSRGCPYALYDSSCRASRSAFRVPAVITSVGQGTITSQTFLQQPDGWFTGGFIEWTHPEIGVERRAIEQHSGDTLLLFGTSDGLTGGLAIDVFPGCDRTAATCRDKFNNLPNYGGMPSMPNRSPFDGNPVF